MALLKKLPGDRYQLDFVLFGHRIRTNFLDENHAQEFLESLEALFPKERMPLGKAIDAYLKAETDKRKSKQTRIMERYWFFELKSYLKKNYRIDVTSAVSLVTRFHLEQFRSELQSSGSSRGRALSNASINRRFAVFKHFFSRLCEWELLKKNPSEYIRKLPETLNRRDRWQEYEIEKAQNAGLFSELELDVFRFLLGTGMRLGSLADIRGQDVNLSEKVLFVRQRKGRGEEMGFYIPIADSLMPMIVRRMPSVSSEYLFNRGDGLKIVTGTISKGILRKLQRMELGHLTVHGLRHTFASRLSERGASTETIRLLLGHSSGKTTERYIHLDLKDLRKWLI